MSDRGKREARSEFTPLVVPLRSARALDWCHLAAKKRVWCGLLGLWDPQSKNKPHPDPDPPRDPGSYDMMRCVLVAITHTRNWTTEKKAGRPNRLGHLCGKTWAEHRRLSVGTSFRGTNHVCNLVQLGPINVPTRPARCTRPNFLFGGLWARLGAFGPHNSTNPGEIAGSVAPTNLALEHFLAQ